MANALETYKEVCENIANWIKIDTNNKINFDWKDVFDLDINFPALAIFALDTHLKNGQNAMDVLVSDEYLAKLVMNKIKHKPI